MLFIKVRKQFIIIIYAQVNMLKQYAQNIKVL